MTWPYHFVDLNDQQKHHRRELLDRYGLYSQLSAFIPVAGYQLYRLGSWVYSERQRLKVDYSAVPSSPVVKRARYSSSGMVVRKWRTVVWWLQDEIVPGWGFGERGQWIATVAWMGWLLFLSVHRTGDDYLHITKRFGEVAVAQFPVHYMLAMKSIHSPLALAFRASHEQLNPWHRLNAKVIYTLLLLHVSWYLNFFIQLAVLTKRLKDKDVIIGLSAFTLLTILVSSSLEIVRKWSYRMFFMLHLMIGVWILPLLFFHATHLRVYVCEALALFVLDVIFRKLDTTTGFATITSVPNTKLLKLKIPVPASKIHRFHQAPGQHIYLSIPPESIPKGTSRATILELLLNPFTVASVSKTDITVVLRALNGPTTLALSALTKLPKAKPPLSIEGPIGSTRHFPNLAARCDRFLLVAGGVGATFILPIYKHLQEQLEAEPRSPDRVTFVWSMRSAAEAQWAVGEEVDGDDENDIDDDENIKIFVSGKNSTGEELLPEDGSVELEDLDKPAARKDGVKINGGNERPDLKKIVDEVFRGGNEERIAVLVCGPAGMAREVRRHVGVWVGKGRDVWFHDEGFGW